MLLREDVPGDKRLVAYVVARSRTATLSATELTAQAKAALPAYMVPSAFVILDAFPLNPSGKSIERRSLPLTSESTGRRANMKFRAAKSRAQSRQSGGGILGVPKVGTERQFLDLGGNSLLALQVHGKLVARARQGFPHP